MTKRHPVVVVGVLLGLGTACSKQQLGNFFDELATSTAQEVALKQQGERTLDLQYWVDCDRCTVQYGIPVGDGQTQHSEVISVDGSWSERLRVASDTSKRHTAYLNVNNLRLDEPTIIRVQTISVGGRVVEELPYKELNMSNPRRVTQHRLNATLVWKSGEWCRRSNEC